MTTVMSWGNSEGTKGRCDDKCHSAQNADCECMCGGRFHGVNFREGGLPRAIDEFGNEVLEAATLRAKAEGVTLETYLQRDLFDSTLAQAQAVDPVPRGTSARVGDEATVIDIREARARASARSAARIDRKVIARAAHLLPPGSRVKEGVMPNRTVELRERYNIQTPHGFVLLEDPGTGRTITNDAENVIAFLAQAKLLAGRRVLYRDTQGVWDELLHDQGVFAGFRSVNARSAREAMSRVEVVQRGGGAESEPFEW